METFFGLLPTAKAAMLDRRMDLAAAEPCFQGATNFKLF